MADSKISALPASTTPLAGTEVLPIVQSSTTKQVSVANLTAGRAVSASTLTASTGNITATAGNFVPSTAAKGMNFTANTPAAGMTSQLLNWYEEGTWTAAFVPSSGSITISPSFNTGGYTKIGRLVTVNLHARFSSVSSPSGSLVVTGLPFTSNSSTQCRNSGTVAALAVTALATPMTAYVSNNANSIVLTGFVAASGGYANAATYIDASSELYITISYYV